MALALRARGPRPLITWGGSAPAFSPAILPALAAFVRRHPRRCRAAADAAAPDAPAPAAEAADAAAPDAPAPPTEAALDDEAAALQAEYERYERFRKAFHEAQTMSQLYNVERPPPVPLEEFEQRRVARETQEVADAARRLFGAPEQATRDALAQIDSLVPGILDLAAMSAREFALLASDVRGAAARVVALRVAWPRADVSRVLRKRPRMLLPADAQATLRRLAARAKGARGGGAAAAAPIPQQQQDDGGAAMAAASLVARQAASVRLALAGGTDPAARAAVAAAAERGGHASVDDAVDAVVEAAPELMDAAELSRALAFVRERFPSSAQHPAALLAENPRLLLNLAESDVDDSAEYGEITTRF